MTDDKAEQGEERKRRRQRIRERPRYRDKKSSQQEYKMIIFDVDYHLSLIWKNYSTLQKNNR